MSLLIYFMLASVGSRVVAQELESFIEIPRYELALKDIVDIPVVSLRNFVVTVPDIIEVQRLPGDLLRIEAVGQGVTFLHIWDSQGRRTYEIQVSGFGTGSVSSQRRKGYDPYGAQLSYRMRVYSERGPGQGWRSPIYEHEFQSRVPIKKDNDWNTMVRALTNTRLLDGPSGVPFSQATEPTYMLSYYRSPHWTFGLGDTAFNPGDLSIVGFPFRGAYLQYRNERDRAEVFGGWARPLYGFGEYLDVQKPQVYGFSGSREATANIHFKNSFVFLNQDGVVGPRGNTLEDDFVYSVGLFATPLKEKWYLEGEYGRSKRDNAMRFLIEYRPYWGSLMGYFRRIGTNYVELSRGYLLNDYQEANLTANFQPFRSLSFSLNYYFTDFGLSESSAYQGKSHSFYLTNRWQQNIDTSLLGSFRLSRNNTPTTSYELERGDVTYQRFFDERRSNLYAKVFAEHEKRSSNSGNRVSDTIAGGFDARYRRFLKENLEFVGRGDLYIAGVSVDNANSEDDSFIRANMSWGPEINYFRKEFVGVAGFNHVLGFGGTNTHLLQPYVSAIYRPNQAIALEARSNMTYDIRDNAVLLNLVGQVTYHFGPGIPDTLFSSVNSKVKVSGNVFLDKDGSGQQEEGEKFLDGFKIVGSDEEIATASGGKYHLKISPQTRQITLVPPKDYESFRVTTANPHPIKAAPGDKIEVNFGVNEGTLLKGRILLDTNGNQTVDPKDVGMRNAEVRITGPGFEKEFSVSNSGEFLIFVPSGGRYEFELLLDKLPIGYKVIGADKHSIEVESRSLAEYEPILVKAERYIVGRAFIDENKNYEFDEGERPLPNIKFQLGSYQGISETDGTILIKEISPGTYIPQVSPSQYQGYSVKIPEKVIFTYQSETLEIPLPYQK